ncbi:peptidase [Sporosarcina pasteurii]|nr:peptidase [Sporosarcina pasteurii]
MTKEKIILTNHWYGYNPHWQAQRQPNQYSRYSRISIDDAMAIALEQIPGEVVKVELDTDNGAFVYEVDIISRQGIKYEFEIDAETGRIIKMHQD